MKSHREQAERRESGTEPEAVPPYRLGSRSVAFWKHRAGSVSIGFAFSYHIGYIASKFMERCGPVINIVII